MNKRLNARKLMNSSGFTPLEIRRQRRLTVARGNLSLTGFTLSEVILAAAILVFALAVADSFISCAFE